MKIVIEIDGTQVASVLTDGAASNGLPAAAMAFANLPPPGPAPPEFDQRAKKMGALSAGAAQLGRGAALHESVANEAPPAKPKKKAPKRAKKTKPRRKG